MSKKSKKILLVVILSVITLCIAGAIVFMIMRSSLPKFSQESYTVSSDETVKITAEYKSMDDVEYSSSDEKIFTVGKDGLITVISGGEGIITARVKNSDMKCTAKVTTVVKVRNIEIENTGDVYVGSSLEIKAVVNPQGASNPEIVWTSSDENIAAVDQMGKITGKKPGKVTITVENKFSGVSTAIEIEIKEKSVSQPPKTPQVNGITYIQGIPIANKTYGLPSTYAPGVDPTAYDAFLRMRDAASKDGINLFIKSGYRSYATQKNIYNNYVSRDGKDNADTYSARPGHSEHQLGLAFDINSLDTSWADTAEGKWLAKNAHRFGFIIRYPKDKVAITGYMYEPWHVRYIGNALAQSVYSSGKCLEEYFGITSRYM